MSVVLELRRTPGSGPLSPARLDAALGVPVAGAPRGAVRGTSLRVAGDMSPDDAAAAAVTIAIERQGAAVTGTARGPASALLAWTFHAMAARLQCELFDAVRGASVQPRPEAHAAAALAYVRRHEAEVLADRRRHAMRAAASKAHEHATGASVADLTDEEELRAEASATARDAVADGAAFLAWLAREEHIALREPANGQGSGDATAGSSSLKLEDPAAAYEVLLESDDVDEVFVGETEFSALVARWRARRGLDGRSGKIT